MKALVYTAPDEVVVREEPDPRPAGGESLLAIDAVGICGSDMHAYHGHDPRRVPPLILGHEIAATVIDGPGAGRRVTVNPLITCGHCDNCLQGRSNLCTDRTMIGMTRPGGFARLMTIPAHCLVDLPNDMAAEHAALAEPAATVIHALDLARRALVRPLPESDVLVIGAGAIGLLTALSLRHFGCRKVRVAETNALRREGALAAGIADVFDPVGGPAAPDAFTLVVDAVGAAATRRAALAAVRPGGTIVHIGLQDHASEIDMRKLTLGEITLIGSYTYSTSDLRAAVDALYRGVFGSLGWVEQRPLSDGPAAFVALAGGATTAAKIVLRPD